MSDLYLAMLLMTVLAGITFAAVRQLVRPWSQRTTNVLALAVVALMIAYVAVVWDKWWLAQVLPFSSLIVLGNWFPLWAAVLAALVCQQTQRRWRCGLHLAFLATVSGFSVVAPLIGDPPACGRSWESGGICIQTTHATCSPACAATLLGFCGIEAEEQEMAELCLTRKGTTWQGLYHGLKRKTAGTAWDVEVVRYDLDQLRSLSGEPVILRVGLARDARVSPDYEREFGWRPGTGHSVVFLGFLPNGQVEVADPTPGIGRERWTVEDLKTLWDGQTVRLLRRS